MYSTKARPINNIPKVYYLKTKNNVRQQQQQQTNKTRVSAPMWTRTVDKITNMFVQKEEKCS